MTEYTDKPIVEELGEDGEAWVVKNTLDHNAARWAILGWWLEHSEYSRDNFASELLEFIDYLNKAKMEYRTDWWWCPAQHDADFLLMNDAETPVPERFSGFRVTL